MQQILVSIGFVEGNLGKIIAVSVLLIFLTKTILNKMNKVIIYKTNLEVGFGKKVLITGASSGLGRELSIIFARHGFIVYAVARRETEL